MNRLDFYKKRFYIVYEFSFELLGYSGTSMEEWKEEVEKAYINREEKSLKAQDKELISLINHYPLEMRREIYKRMEAELGIDAGEIEKKYQKKIQTILNRGRIKNRGEYELIHSHVDSLSNGISSGKPIPEDLLKLHRILMDYSMSFDPTTSPHRDD